MGYIIIIDSIYFSREVTANFQWGPVSQVQVQEYSAQHRRNKTNLKKKQTYIQEVTCVQKLVRIKIMLQCMGKA